MPGLKKDLGLWVYTLMEEEQRVVVSVCVCCGGGEKKQQNDPSTAMGSREDIELSR